MELPAQLLIAVSVVALLAACAYQLGWGAHSSQQQRSRSGDQQRPRELTLRVDGIPTRTSITEVQNNLQSIIAADPDLQDQVDEVIVRSLAPQDNSWACATVTARTRVPESQLLARLNHAGKTIEYDFDCAFYNITPLYEDPNGVDYEYVLSFLLNFVDLADCLIRS